MDARPVGARAAGGGDAMTTEAKIKLKTVDADGHYMEPQDLRPYIEAKYRDVAPHRIVKEDGARTGAGATGSARAASTSATLCSPARARSTRRGCSR